MEYKQVVEDLKKGKIAPVYFFYGEEKYTLNEATMQVINAAVDDTVKDFNLDIFYGSEVDSARILDVAKSYPMMAQRRTVVVKEVQKLSSGNLTALAKYVESPSATTCLVLVAPVDRISGKTYEQLKKQTVSIEFKPLYDNQVPTWIVQYVKRQNKEITPRAAQLLHEYVGTSLLNIVNELEKILLNLDERKRIEENDVQQVVGFSRTFNVFHLLDALGQKDLTQALLIIEELLEHGENAPGIIVRMTNYFGTLLKCLEGQKQKKTDSDIAKMAGVNQFFVKKYRSQAANYTALQIEKIFDMLLTADLHLKTSYQTPKLIMELLIYKISRLN